MLLLFIQCVMEEDKYIKTANYNFTSGSSFPMEIDSFKKKKSSFNNTF